MMEIDIYINMNKKWHRNGIHSLLSSTNIVPSDFLWIRRKG